jgi:hypothetical protein
MAIEGPLKELGIHDVFQLLDLSRKTGALRVTSGLRDNEGTVYFDKGRVTHAIIRSNPHPLGAILQRSGKISEADLRRARDIQTSRNGSQKLGEILVEIGSITERELERQVRLQIEAVVFELMSWREGFFSFEDGQGQVPAEANVRISTDALLMEGARRIDEWSRISDKVPGLNAVPTLAAVTDEHSSQLDLLPNEWEVLTMIDGVRDLRAIATMLGRSEFDIAKIAYGLATTGVVELRLPNRVSGGMIALGDVKPHIEQAKKMLAEGKIDQAIDAAYQAIAADDTNIEARVLHARALVRAGRHGEALDELKQAARIDPLNGEVHCELGFAAARRGNLSDATVSWRQYLSLSPDAPDTEQVRAAIEHASTLARLIQGKTGG